MKCLIKRISAATLGLFYTLVAVADLYIPGGNNGNAEQELKDKADQFTGGTEMVVSIIGGVVALIMALIIGIVWFRDRSQAIDMMWNWAGGVFLLSAGTAVAALLM